MGWYSLPAPPRPATARPKIKKLTLVATPQKREPISNHTTDMRLKEDLSTVDKYLNEDGTY